YENEMFSGKVNDLAPAADPSNGLYPVELSLNPNNKRLAPGLFASVEITPSKSRNYTSIPLEALVEGSGLGAYVFVPQPDSVSVKKLPVLVAYIEGKYAVISNGLDTVEAVVTSGAPYLTEKKKIKMIKGAY
ncbi:MAG: hypothetical protein JNJ57_14535, partial [Saprospiraceae bacterium]|nr:hypothetical protein [Saprospiraceae bacterium]